MKTPTMDFKDDLNPSVDTSNMTASQIEIEQEHQDLLDMRKMSTDLIQDKGNVIYYVYLLYGFGVLVTFNSVLTTL